MQGRGKVKGDGDGEALNKRAAAPRVYRGAKRARGRVGVWRVAREQDLRLERVAERSSWRGYRRCTQKAGPESAKYQETERA